MVSVFDIIRERNKQITGKGFFDPAVKAESQQAKQSVFEIIAERQKVNRQSSAGAIGLKKTGRTKTNINVIDRNVELAQRSRVSQASTPSTFAFGNPIAQEKSVINQGFKSAIRNVEVQDVAENPALFLNFVRVQGVNFRNFLGGLFGQ